MKNLNDRIVRPDLIEEQDENLDGADATEELAAAASSNQDRRRSGTANSTRKESETSHDVS